MRVELKFTDLISPSVSQKNAAADKTIWEYIAASDYPRQEGAAKRVPLSASFPIMHLISPSLAIGSLIRGGMMVYRFLKVSRCHDMSG